MLRKITCAITVFCFTATTMLWGAPISSLPMLHEETPASLKIVPSELGTVQDSFLIDQFKKSTSGSELPLIIHLQDAHANVNAQVNIMKLLDFLSQEYGIRLVALEGTDRGLNVNPYRQLGTREILEPLVSEFIERRIFTGVEGFGILRKDAEAEIKFLGAEDRVLYLKDLSLYRAALRDQKEALESLKTFEQFTNQALQEMSQKRFRELLVKREAFDEGLIELVDYLKFLKHEVDQAHLNVLLKHYPVLSRFFEHLEQIEKNPAFELEAQAEETKLVRSLSTEEQHEYWRLKQKISSGEAELSSLRIFSDQRLSARNESWARYPKFRRYLGHFGFLSDLASKSFFDEIRALEWDLAAALMILKSEKTLFEIKSKLRLLCHLFGLKLVPEEFDEIRSTLDEFDFHLLRGRMMKLRENFASSKTELPSAQTAERLNSWFRSFLEFYAVAETRDQALVNRTLELMKQEKLNRAVLFTGGFHAKGIGQLVKSRGMAYVSVAPRITEFGKDDEAVYRSLIEGEFPHEARSTSSREIHSSYGMADADGDLTGLRRAAELRKVEASSEREIASGVRRGTLGFTPRQVATANQYYLGLIRLMLNEMVKEWKHKNPGRQFHWTNELIRSAQEKLNSIHSSVQSMGEPFAGLKKAELFKSQPYLPPVVLVELKEYGYELKGQPVAMKDRQGRAYRVGARAREFVSRKAFGLTLDTGFARDSWAEFEVVSEADAKEMDGVLRLTSATNKRNTIHVIDLSRVSGEILKAFDEAESLLSSPSMGEDQGGGEDVETTPHSNLPPQGGKGRIFKAARILKTASKFAAGFAVAAVTMATTCAFPQPAGYNVDDLPPAPPPEVVTIEHAPVESNALQPLEVVTRDQLTASEWAGQVSGFNSATGKPLDISSSVRKISGTDVRIFETQGDLSQGSADSFVSVSVTFDGGIQSDGTSAVLGVVAEGADSAHVQLLGQYNDRNLHSFGPVTLSNPTAGGFYDLLGTFNGLANYWRFDSRETFLASLRKIEVQVPKSALRGGLTTARLGIAAQGLRTTANPPIAPVASYDAAHLPLEQAHIGGVASLIGFDKTENARLTFSPILGGISLHANLKDRDPNQNPPGILIKLPLDTSKIIPALFFRGNFLIGEGLTAVFQENGTRLEGFDYPLSGITKDQYALIRFMDQLARARASGANEIYFEIDPAQLEDSSNAVIELVSGLQLSEFQVEPVPVANFGELSNWSGVANLVLRPDAIAAASLVTNPDGSHTITGKPGNNVSWSLDRERGDGALINLDDLLKGLSRILGIQTNATAVRAVVQDANGTFIDQILIPIRSPNKLIVPGELYTALTQAKNAAGKTLVLSQGHFLTLTALSDDPTQSVSFTIYPNGVSLPVDPFDRLPLLETVNLTPEQADTQGLNVSFPRAGTGVQYEFEEIPLGIVIINGQPQQLSQRRVTVRKFPDNPNQQFAQLILTGRTTTQPQPKMIFEVKVNGQPVSGEALLVTLVRNGAEITYRGKTGGVELKNALLPPGDGIEYEIQITVSPSFLESRGMDVSQAVIEVSVIGLNLVPPAELRANLQSRREFLKRVGIGIVKGVGLSVIGSTTTATICANGGCTGSAVLTIPGGEPTVDDVTTANGLSAVELNRPVTPSNFGEGYTVQLIGVNDTDEGDVINDSDRNFLTPDGWFYFDVTNSGNAGRELLFRPGKQRDLYQEPLQFKLEWNGGFPRRLKWSIGREERGRRRVIQFYLDTNRGFGDTPGGEKYAVPGQYIDPYILDPNLPLQHRLFWVNLRALMPNATDEEVDAELEWVLEGYNLFGPAITDVDAYKNLRQETSDGLSLVTGRLKVHIEGPMLNPPLPPLAPPVLQELPGIVSADAVAAIASQTPYRNLFRGTTIQFFDGTRDLVFVGSSHASKTPGHVRMVASLPHQAASASASLLSDQAFPAWPSDSSIPQDGLYVYFRVPELTDPNEPIIDSFTIKLQPDDQRNNLPLSYGVKRSRAPGDGGYRLGVWTAAYVPGRFQLEEAKIDLNSDNLSRPTQNNETVEMDLYFPGAVAADSVPVEGSSELRKSAVSRVGRTYRRPSKISVLLTSTLMEIASLLPLVGPLSCGEVVIPTAPEPVPTVPVEPPPEPTEPPSQPENPETPPKVSEFDQKFDELTQSLEAWFQQGVGLSRFGNPGDRRAEGGLLIGDVTPTVIGLYMDYLSTVASGERQSRYRSPSTARRELMTQLARLAASQEAYGYLGLVPWLTEGPGGRYVPQAVTGGHTQGSETSFFDNGNLFLALASVVGNLPGTEEAALAQEIMNRMFAGFQAMVDPAQVKFWGGFKLTRDGAGKVTQVEPLGFHIDRVNQETMPAVMLLASFGIDQRVWTNLLTAEGAPFVEVNLPKGKVRILRAFVKQEKTEKAFHGDQGFVMMDWIIWLRLLLAAGETPLIGARLAQIYHDTAEVLLEKAGEGIAAPTTIPPYGYGSSGYPDLSEVPDEVSVTVEALYPLLLMFPSLEGDSRKKAEALVLAWYRNNGTINVGGARIIVNSKNPNTGETSRNALGLDTAFSDYGLWRSKNQGPTGLELYVAQRPELAAEFENLAHVTDELLDFIERGTVPPEEAPETPAPPQAPSAPGQTIFTETDFRSAAKSGLDAMMTFVKAYLAALKPDGYAVISEGWLSGFAPFWTNSIHGDLSDRPFGVFEEEIQLRLPEWVEKGYLQKLPASELRTDIVPDEEVLGHLLAEGKIVQQPIEGNIRAVELEDIPSLRSFTQKQRNKYRFIMTETLKRGKIARMVLAGGASSRMPLNKPEEWPETLRREAQEKWKLVLSGQAREILSGQSFEEKDELLLSLQISADSQKQAGKDEPRLEFTAKALVPVEKVGDKWFTFLGLALHNHYRVLKHFGIEREKFPAIVPLGSGNNKPVLQFLDEGGYRQRLDLLTYVGKAGRRVIPTEEIVRKVIAGLRQRIEKKDFQSEEEHEDLERRIIGLLDFIPYARVHAGEIIPSPPVPRGHGGIFHNMFIDANDYSLAIDLLSRKINYLYTGNIDNSAARLDDAWLIEGGYFIDEQFDMLAEVSLRPKGQAGGTPILHLDLPGHPVQIAEDPSLKGTVVDPKKAPLFNNASAFFTINYLMKIYDTSRAAINHIAQLEPSQRKERLTKIANAGFGKYPINPVSRPVSVQEKSHPLYQRIAEGVAFETLMWESTGVLAVPPLRVQVIKVGSVENLRRLIKRQLNIPNSTEVANEQIEQYLREAETQALMEHPGKFEAVARYNELLDEISWLRFAPTKNWDDYKGINPLALKLFVPAISSGQSLIPLSELRAGISDLQRKAREIGGIPLVTAVARKLQPSAELRFTPQSIAEFAKNVRERHYLSGDTVEIQFKKANHETIEIVHQNIKLQGLKTGLVIFSHFDNFFTPTILYIKVSENRKIIRLSAENIESITVLFLSGRGERVSDAGNIHPSELRKISELKLRLTGGQTWQDAYGKLVEDVAPLLEDAGTDLDGEKSLRFYQDQLRVIFERDFINPQLAGQILAERFNRQALLAASSPESADADTFPFARWGSEVNDFLGELGDVLSAELRNETAEVGELLQHVQNPISGPANAPAVDRYVLRHDTTGQELVRVLQGNDPALTPEDITVGMSGDFALTRILNLEQYQIGEGVSINVRRPELRRFTSNGILTQLTTVSRKALISVLLAGFLGLNLYVGFHTISNVVQKDAAYRAAFQTLAENPDAYLSAHWGGRKVLWNESGDVYQSLGRARSYLEIRRETHEEFSHYKTVTDEDGKTHQKAVYRTRFDYYYTETGAARSQLEQAEQKAVELGKRGLEVQEDFRDPEAKRIFEEVKRIREGLPNEKITITSRDRWKENDTFVPVRNQLDELMTAVDAKSAAHAGKIPQDLTFRKSKTTRSLGFAWFLTIVHSAFFIATSIVIGRKVFAPKRADADGTDVPSELRTEVRGIKGEPPRVPPIAPIADRQFDSKPDQKDKGEQGEKDAGKFWEMLRRPQQGKEPAASPDAQANPSASAPEDEPDLTPTTLGGRVLKARLEQQLLQKGQTQTSAELRQQTQPETIKRAIPVLARSSAPAGTTIPQAVSNWLRQENEKEFAAEEAGRSQLIKEKGHALEISPAARGQAILNSVEGAGGIKFSKIFGILGGIDWKGSIWVIAPGEAHAAESGETVLDVRQIYEIQERAIANGESVAVEGETVPAEQLQKIRDQFDHAKWHSLMTQVMKPAQHQFGRAVILTSQLTHGMSDGIVYSLAFEEKLGSERHYFRIVDDTETADQRVELERLMQIVRTLPVSKARLMVVTEDQIGISAAKAGVEKFMNRALAAMNTELGDSELARGVSPDRSASLLWNQTAVLAAAGGGFMNLDAAQLQGYVQKDTDSGLYDLTQLTLLATAADPFALVKQIQDIQVINPVKRWFAATGRTFAQFLEFARRAELRILVAA